MLRTLFLAGTGALLAPIAAFGQNPADSAKSLLWFTVQGANMIGRLNPRTGEVKLVEVPTPHALPYGMVVSSKGVPFFAEFGTNKIGEIDPTSMVIREHGLPNPGARPRRMMATRDGELVLAESGAGKVALVDIRK
jgi:virginiamycin B lyase